MSYNNLIQSLKDHLQRKHQCHSMILYGSFATGDVTETSDIDMLCFSDSVIARQDMELFEGKPLDVWIHTTDEMADESSFLHVHSGVVMLDERGLCQPLLDKIQDAMKRGPEALSVEDCEYKKKWIRKMAERAVRGDVEGNFRYHWLLVDMLELYFSFIGEWYLGPKKSLAWLKAHQPEVFCLFQNALARDAWNEALFELVNRVCEARQREKAIEP